MDKLPRMDTIDEYFEDFSNVSLGTLRNRYEQYQNFQKTPSWVVRDYSTGKFHRIKSKERPTVIRLSDGGVVGYRVPACLVDGSLGHVEDLEKWTAMHGAELRKTKDTTRGVSCVRKYAHWVKYNTERIPKLSNDYREDGEKATEFFQCSQVLWDRAREWFPKHHNERVFKDFGRYDLNGGKKRLCGLWTGCAINVGSENEPVQTIPHRDVKGFLFGMSCLCPFGQFSGAGLVLWELCAIVELRRGDLFYFTDHLINHSNEKVGRGVWHSVVAFMEHRMWEWMQREYKRKDHRIEKTRLYQKRYREERRRRERKNTRHRDLP